MKIFQSAGMLNMSDIKLSNFYGIELDDFAHEVAILSLWLAQHQMNIEFKKTFGDCTPTLLVGFTKENNTLKIIILNMLLLQQIQLIKVNKSQCYGDIF